MSTGVDGRRHVADLITLGNAMCGTGAIVVAAAAVPGSYGVSLRPVALLLLFGTIFDVFDGFAARRWGATPLGRPLDAMADLISFGLAPALALGIPAVRSSTGALRVFMVVAILVYVAGALRRLAEFSATSATTAVEGCHFTGLPSPTAALVVLAAGFLGESQTVAACALLAAGVLMVSRFHYPGQSGVIPALSAVGWVVGLLSLAGVLNPRLVAALVIGGALVIPLAARRRVGAVSSREH